LERLTSLLLLKDMLKDGCQIKSSFEIAVALTDNSIPLLLMLPTLAHVLSKMLGGTGTLYSKSRSLVVRSYKSSVKEKFLKKVTSTPKFASDFFSHLKLGLGLLDGLYPGIHSP